MTFRTDILDLEDAVMSALLGPSGLDVTPHLVTVRTRTWSGGRKGKGTTSDADLPIVGANGQRYATVRQVTLKEINDTGGRYRAGDIRVEDIVPSDGGSIGFTPKQLAPSSAVDGVEILYVVTGFGGLAGNYDLVEGRFDDAFEYSLTLRARRDTPAIP